MGTNFYCRHIPTEEEYQQMQENLQHRNYEKLEKQLKEFRKTYHIGKRSGGWQFIWCPHKEGNIVVSPWENNLESIKNYLSQENTEIFDEYGKTYTYEQLIEEIKDSLYTGESLKHQWTSSESKCLSFMANADNYEFISDGLRFSTNCDFV